MPFAEDPFIKMPPPPAAPLNPVPEAVDNLRALVQRARRIANLANRLRNKVIYGSEEMPEDSDNRTRPDHGPGLAGAMNTIRDELAEQLNEIEALLENLGSQL